MKKFILLNIIFSLFSYSGIAATIVENSEKPYVHEYAFLSDGFNLQNYNSCKTLIEKMCPAKSTTPNCANALAEKPICSQLNQLSQAIGAQMSSVSVKQQDNTMLVSQSFTADGQYEYYIITSFHQIIDTNIDPFKLNERLRQKYQKISLLPVYNGEPKVQLLQNKQQIYDFSMKGHDTCLACKVVVSYDLRFTFDKDGKFINVQLRNIRNGCD
ncbi:MAG TPA: hypothetical protein VKR58_03520 [Aquella sp.]|nr:hypothetical protein [Aquella sp.]